MDCSLFTCAGSTSTTAPDGAGSGLQPGCARTAAGSARKARAVATIAATDEFANQSRSSSIRVIRAYLHFSEAQTVVIVIAEL
jgi:hypothetical protein